MSGSMPISTQPSLAKARSRVDRLINLDDFYTHVRHCRWAFGVGLAVAIVGQALRMPDMVLIWGILSPAKWKKGWWMVEGATWMAGALLLAVAAFTFLFSLRSSSVPRPYQITEEEESTVSERTPLLPPNTLSSPEPPLPTFDSFRRYSRHITILFFISFLALAIRPLPSIIFVLRTHRAPPHLTFSAHSRQSLLRIVGNIGNWAMFLSVGMMRRGPEMRYDPPKVGTGFGLKAGVYDAQEGDDQGEKEAVSCQAECAAVKVAGKAREVPNVFDYDGCCLLSFIFVGYALHIGVLSGRKNKLDISDLPHLTYTQRAENIVLPLEGRVFIPVAHTSTFQPTISAGSRSPPKSQKRGGLMNVGSWELAKLLWRGKGSIIMTNIIFEWAKVLAGFLPPYCLHEVVKSFDDQRSKHDKSYPLLMCAGLFVGMFSETVLASYVGVAEHVKLHLPVRSMLNISLFSKILHSVDAKSAEAERGTGKDGNSQGRAQILNLLLIDGKRVGELGLRAFSISNALLSVVIGVIYLYMMFGWAAFVGMAVIPLAAPFSYWISVYRYRVDRDLSRAQDARVSAINEFLLSVKVIKLNAWDEHFVKRISILRDREIRLQRKRYHIGTGFNVLSDQLPLCAILVIFFTYTKVMGQALEPATAFVAMAVFGKVKAAISMVPDVISALLLARISLGRLGCYFSKPEVAALGQGTPSNGQIRLKQATVAWPTSDAKKDQIDDLTEQTDFKLQNLTVDIPQNALTLISGPLGSGKTLFLLALLGEARLLSGEIEAPRSDPDALPLPEDQVDVELTLDAWLDPSMSAYSSQISYIKHGDIRDNILNGLPMWHERYAAVLRQCALIPDLKLFDHADLTEVGEQGVTLSGGQRARISLARCVYSRAKTLYLDDILSAVDAHTARHLYQHCLKGDLLKNRTVVLVSHNVNLVLPSAQYVVHIENGVIERSGSAKDFSASEVDVNAEDGDLNLLLDPVDPVELDTVSSAVIPTEIRRIYEEEKREIGQVDRRNYAFLFQCAGGAIYWSIFALIYGGTEFFNFLQTLWLKYWTRDGRPERLGHYLTGYAIIVTLGILTGAFRWVWLYGIRLGNVRVGFTDSAAPKIHEMMLRHLVGSPLALFNSWPTGRLLNRFSGDISQIDGCISDDVGRSVSAVLAFASSVLVISIKAPTFLLITALLLVPFELLRRFFSKARAELRRLSATVGSPVVTICNNAINSVAVVRAFGTGRIMSQAMSVFTDVDRRTTLSDCIVWQSFSLIILTAASLLVTITGFILVSTQDISGASAGFVLSFALASSTGLLSLLERLTYLDQSMVAVERLNEICRLPSENEGAKPIALPPSWPRDGSIQIRGLSIRYAEDLPDVLHELNLDIEGGQRIALVGATGSGKSTFALSLFRAIEAHEGAIYIDGVDIAQVALHDLRSRLTAITQEPLLTSGTLRETLDISRELDDHDLYEVLKRVHLITGDESAEEKAKNPFHNLESYVAIEGSNFSLGERQLLVLARALLKRSKIIVMDEATSNVDYETDAKITDTLKTSFARGTTLVTIAHRLRTIIDYDHVIVLDKGRVIEEGSPLELIKNTSSAFHGLCSADGPVEYDYLLQVADAAERGISGLSTS